MGQPAPLMFLSQIFNLKNKNKEKPSNQLVEAAVARLKRKPPPLLPPARITRVLLSNNSKVL